MSEIYSIKAPLELSPYSYEWLIELIKDRNVGEVELIHEGDKFCLEIRKARVSIIRENEPKDAPTP